MAREARVIPDICFVEGEGVEGQEEGPEGKTTEDLTKDGFIPIQNLRLEDLPGPIRTQQHLQLILDFSKNVVRINNHKLSDQRPENDQFKQSKEKGICGSGFLVNLQREGVFLTTNRHVLHNEEELQESTFNIFFGSRHGEKMLYKKCRKGNGKFFLGKYSVDDVAHAFYMVDDKMAENIKNNCPNTKELQRHLEHAIHPGLGDDRNLKPIVCLISHPLGQPKHVSFGEMVQHDMKSRTIYHNAPSKPGSSGAPVIVFSKYHNLMALSTCHVGKCRETGLKFARVQYFEVSAVDIYDSICKSKAMEKQEATEEAKEEKSTNKSMASQRSTPLSRFNFPTAVSAFGDLLKQAPRLTGSDNDDSFESGTMEKQEAKEEKSTNKSMASQRSTPLGRFDLATAVSAFGDFLKPAEPPRSTGSENDDSCESGTMEKQEAKEETSTNKSMASQRSITLGSFNLATAVSAFGVFLKPAEPPRSTGSDNDDSFESGTMEKQEAKEEKSTEERMASETSSTRPDISKLTAAVPALVNLFLEQPQQSRSTELDVNASAPWQMLQTSNPSISSDQPWAVGSFVASKVAKALVKPASLAAFLPVFGAFLIQAEKTGLDGFDTSALQPCKAISAEDFASLCEMKKDFDRIAHVAPSFTLCPPDNLHNVSDLVSQGPCFCRSIVRLMEKGRLVDGAAIERYLTPQTAAAQMSSVKAVEMLWSNMGDPDLQIDTREEDCLLKRCLKLGERITTQVALLHMIVKANGYVQQLFPQASRGSSTSSSREEEKDWETPCSRERSERPSQRSQEKESSTANKEDALIRLVYDILTIHHLGLMLAALTLAVRPANEDQTERDPTSPLSRCLAVSHHARQHERQTHRDLGRAGQEESRCQCGRPGLRDVWVAHMSLTSLLEGRIHEASLCQTGGFLADSLTEMEARCVHLVTAIQTGLNMVDASSSIKKWVTLFLASGEACLYNYCLLARYVSSLFQPRYCALPVSVFGRPGSRPGHVTQPEFQDTAWETIKDAILASDFPPTRLIKLAQDADRRQKLIDVFVDMKQLKREGRINPDLFEEHLERSSMCLFDFSHGGFAFEDCTHFFVWNVAFLLCPRFVGSCTGSRDPRRKPLMSLVRRLFDAGDCE